ncbi:TPA_asm: maturation protein [ssRNA phage SRR5466727_1]|uniref:Maturation protein n=1 Tax=ssRNA phage SRR5466727_1 TaxID=2786429 RepID=A0A8S5L075_9VIRU|nr:maturation protein [ssRNA phage SRR5466727_1]DAD50851.1 TPA_asm: maturation protein [ssRNA phage SRR5466727_1]
MSTGHYFTYLNYDPAKAYNTFATRNWSGQDDPLKKSRWNVYNVDGEVFSSTGNMGCHTINVAFSSDDDLRLQDKFVSAVRRHEFHAGKFLAQSDKVVRSIHGTYTAFRNMRQRFLKGDVNGACRFLARSVSGNAKRSAKRKLDTGDLAGAHLALVYGWAPLVSDVFHAATALEVLANPPRRTSVTVTRTRKLDFEGSAAPGIYTCPGNAAVSKKIIFEMAEEMSEARSLGLYDLPAAIHEATPWSFVVDWFVPIGTYLTNLGVIPFLRGTYKITTFYRGQAGGCTVLNPAASAPWVGHSAKIRHFTVARLPLTTTLDVVLPSFRGFNQLYENGQRIANSVALLRNLWTPDVQNNVRQVISKLRR